MRLDVHHFYHQDPEVEQTARRRHTFIVKLLEKIMRTLEETLAAVEAESTSIQSISTLLAGIKKQLDDALGGALTPSQQMRVDAIFNKAQANKEQLDAAIKANDGVTDEDEKAEPHVEAASSASPANVGDTIIFSASVLGVDPAPVPTGTVTFSLDGNALGTGTLDGEGVAQFTFNSPVPAGDHQLVAAYTGDANYRAGQSEAVTQTIVAPGNQS